MRCGRVGGGRVVRSIPWILLILAVPGSAAAALRGEARSDVRYAYSQEFCGVGVDYDTGWVPSGADVQVRMQFRLNCEFGAELEGEGVMVWPPAMQLYFQGKPRRGTFSESVGVYFDTRIKWDLDIPGLGTFRGESPIPFIPSIDLGCLDRRVQFTPFLLSGNPDRPANLLCQIPRIRVFEYNLLSLLGIPDVVQAVLRIDLGMSVNSYFQGNRIVVSEHDQVITEEYGRAYVYPRSAPALNLTAQYYADVSHQIVITIYPQVIIKVLVFEYGFDIIDVPIPLPEMRDEWVFDPAEMTFYFPDIMVEDTLDFGRTQVDRPRLKRFAIENVGFSDLDVRARTALPFGVDPALGDPELPPLTIGSPGVDDMVVSFDPDGEGRATGILRLETSDPDEPWVDVNLVGEATWDDVGEYTDPDDCTDAWCFGIYDSGRGCGCRAAGAPVSGFAVLLGLLGLLALRRRR